MLLVLEDEEPIIGPDRQDVLRGLNRLDAEECRFLILLPDDNQRLIVLLGDGGHFLFYENDQYEEFIRTELIIDKKTVLNALYEFMDGTQRWRDASSWRPGGLQDEIGAPVSGWLNIAAWWPIYLLFIGGAIGGVSAALAISANFKTLRSRLQPWLKVLLVAISGIWAFALYALLGIVFLVIMQLLFGS